MIRTLFVEDEYFVRQGFVHSLPWERYGITIVGEADNGSAALDFLRDNEVDLLITDLTMPVKSGLELLQTAKKLYPALPTVVLTCHRDFDFIQEALRLGALDYIVKTRLDSQEIEQSLGRIRDRLMQRQAAGRREETAILLVPTEDAIPDWPDCLQGGSGQGATRVGGHARYIPGLPDEAVTAKLAEEAASAGWAIMRVTGAPDDDRRAAEKRLAEFVARSFPYRWHAAGGIEAVSLADADRRTKKQQSDAYAEAMRRWQSYDWVFEDGEFADWTAFVADHEPPFGELGTALGDTIRGWLLSDGMKDAGMDEFGPLPFAWEQWAERLRGMRECLIRRYASLHYSREVYASALKSLDTIRSQLKNGLQQSEVARLVGLSRSYFSQVFKETFGMSFNEYARACSINVARKLLAGSEYPFYWIAEQSGFQDERYFSRVFRESTGLLPSEYRCRHANVNNRTS